MKTAVCKQWLLVTLALMVAEAVAVAAPGVSGENQATLAIVGGRLIDGFGGPPLEDAVILIEDDTIVAVGRVGQLAVPDSARVVDSNGMTVLPGLWDAHGHLWHVGEGKPGEFRDKFRDRMMEIMDAVAQTNLMAGITSFRDLGGPLGEQQALRADIESGKRIGPRLYLAGPLVRQRDKNPGVSPDEYTVGTPDEARAIAKTAHRHESRSDRCRGALGSTCSGSDYRHRSRGRHRRGRGRAAYSGLPHCHPGRRGPVAAGVHSGSAVRLQR